MHARSTLLAIALCLFATTFATAETHVWILAGQSNMRGGQSRYAKALQALVEAKGHEFKAIYSSAPGKPIAAWLDETHKDYAKLWAQAMQEQVTAALAEGGVFKGMAWYQGESDSKQPLGYETDLAELVRRVRALTKVNDLPVIVVQLAAHVGYRADHGWNVAVVREAQRRFVEADPHAALVTAIDCEVGDYTVHLSGRGHEQVSRGIAAAAKHLAYQGPADGWGPRVDRAFIGDNDRRTVVVTFRDVKGRLTLGEGWRQGFALSRQRGPLPKTLADASGLDTWPPLHESFESPTGAKVVGTNQVLLTFAKPIGPRAAISFAPSANAQFGPHRRWNLEFNGVYDNSGQHAAAFLLLPIENKPAGFSLKEPVEAIEQAATYRPDQAFQIAVNCIGRFPDAVRPPSAEAGVPGWRQPWWNPVSNHVGVNLFDSGGRGGPVAFQTGVWYMSPYYRELESADDALMASWCKHHTHGFTGLAPGAAHDLAVYLLQGPDKNEPGATHRTVRVTLMHLDAKGKRDNAAVLAQSDLRVPATGSFDGYQIATEANGHTGHVVVFEGVQSDAHGRIHLTVESSWMKGDQVKWKDTTLAGVQIRRRK